MLIQLFAAGPQPFGGLKLRFQQLLAGLAAGRDFVPDGRLETVRLLLEGQLGVEVPPDHRFGQGVKQGRNFLRGRPPFLAKLVPVLGDHQFDHLVGAEFGRAGHLQVEGGVEDPAGEVFGVGHHRG